jgi:glutamine synthetase
LNIGPTKFGCGLRAALSSTKANALKPKAVLAYCREKGIRAVDLRFPDLGGRWKHVTFPVSALTEGAFESGFGQELMLRGVEGEVREQMVLLPLSDANYLDPLLEQPTLVILASVHDALTRIESWMDSRAIAMRATEYLRATGIADEAFVRSIQPWTLVHAPVANRERGIEPASRRFLSCGPDDLDFAFRCRLSSSAAEAGVNIERHYRGEHASSEVVLGSLPLLECCDDLMMVRAMMDQMAVQHPIELTTAGLFTSTQWTLQKSGEGIFGSGMHTSSPNGVSELGWHAVGGILQHASALAAIAIACSVQREDASASGTYPWRLAVADAHAWSLCNIIYGANPPRSRAIEFRGAPARSNPYLVQSAILMAMIDGIQNKTPMTGLDGGREIVAWNEGQIDGLPLVQALSDDRDFLLAGSVFSEPLLDWIAAALQTL